MKHKLTNLFDLQRFHNNRKLAALIEETQTRLNKEICEEDLTKVSAAGDVNSRRHSLFTVEGKADD